MVGVVLHKQQVSYYNTVDTVLKFENLVNDFYKIQKKCTIVINPYVPC
jgi:hypothetical protein